MRLEAPERGCALSASASASTGERPRERRRTGQSVGALRSGLPSAPHQSPAFNRAAASQQQGEVRSTEASAPTRQHLVPHGLSVAGTRTITITIGLRGVIRVPFLGWTPEKGLAAFPAPRIGPLPSAHPAPTQRPPSAHPALTSLR